MQVSCDVIAKKYAVAFLNLYIDQVTDQSLKKIFGLEKFLKQHKQFYVYLGIPTISTFIKQKALNRVAQTLELSKPIKKLMFVLLEHGRIEILDVVLNQIAICFRQRKNIASFRVTTSHFLSEAEKTSVKNFIKQVSKTKIVTEFFVDKKIICGIRIQSRSFLWERSVVKQLRDVKRFIFNRVGLC